MSLGAFLFYTCIIWQSGSILIWLLRLARIWALSSFTILLFMSWKKPPWTLVLCPGIVKTARCFNSNNSSLILSSPPFSSNVCGKICTTLFFYVKQPCSVPAIINSKLNICSSLYLFKWNLVKGLYIYVYFYIVHIWLILKLSETHFQTSCITW